MDFVADPAGNRMREVIQQSIELSKSGEHTKAVGVLDEALAHAVRDHNKGWIRVLCRHTAAICQMMGDLPLARYYYQTLLTHSPDDRLGLYGLANSISSEGDADDAKMWAAKCYTAC